MKTISSRQLTYAAGAFIIASSLVGKGVYVFAKNQGWIPALLGVITSLAIISIYIALAKKHPGLDLIEINDAVYGPIIGKIVSFFYVFYFLSLVILNTHDMGNFVVTMVLPNTPTQLIYALFIVVCAAAAGKGAVQQTSYGTLFSFIAILIIVVHAFFLLNLVEPKNLLPVFTLPVKDYLIGTQIVTMMPLCELIVFMMYLPHMKDTAAFGKGLVRGLLIGSGVLLIVVLRDTTIQGGYLQVTSLPTFSTIRLIDIGDILTRLDIIYAVTLMSLSFFKVSTLFYATVSGFCGMLRIKQHKPYILIFGALVVVYTSASFRATYEHDKWKMTTAAMYSTFFILVLPLLTLIVSMVREYAGKRKLPDAAGNS